MNISVQKCFVEGCHDVFPTSFGFYKHMIEHNISMSPVYCCEQCSCVLNDDEKFRQRDNLLMNRKMYHMKVALNPKKCKPDDAEEMLQKQITVEANKQPAHENKAKDSKTSTGSLPYQCYFMHCYNYYARRYQFKHHLLHAHGVCLVPKDFCQFCSNILEQFNHFGKKIKLGGKRRSSADNMAPAEAVDDTQAKQKRHSIDEEKLPREEKSFEEFMSECLEVNIREECSTDPAQE